MTSLLRLSVCLTALTLILSLMGCSKPEDPTVITTKTSAQADTNRDAPASTTAAAATSNNPGADSMNKALNDPNTPRDVKDKIRQQMSGK